MRPIERYHTAKEAKIEEKKNLLVAGLATFASAVAGFESYITGNDGWLVPAIGFGLGAAAFWQMSAIEEQDAAYLSGKITKAQRDRRNAQEIKKHAQGLGALLSIPAVGTALDYFVLTPLQRGHLLPFDPSGKGLLVNGATMLLAAGFFGIARYASYREKKVDNLDTKPPFGRLISYIKGSRR